MGYHCILSRPHFHNWCFTPMFSEEKKEQESEKFSMETSMSFSAVPRKKGFEWSAFHGYYTNVLQIDSAHENKIWIQLKQLHNPSQGLPILKMWPMIWQCLAIQPQIAMGPVLVRVSQHWKISEIGKVSITHTEQCPSNRWFWDLSCKEWHIWFTFSSVHMNPMPHCKQI